MTVSENDSDAAGEGLVQHPKTGVVAGGNAGDTSLVVGAPSDLGWDKENSWPPHYAKAEAENAAKVFKTKALLEADATYTKVMRRLRENQELEDHLFYWHTAYDRS